MSFLIAIAPLLLLVLALCLQRYPGEAAIGKVRRLVERAFSAAVGGPVRRNRIPDFPLTVRGGLLIASSLAGRGPPPVQ